MRGDLLIGIVVTTILATVINEAARQRRRLHRRAPRWPSDVYETPDLSLLGNFNFDAFTELAFISAVVWAFSLFLADFFDTMGTLVGVGKPAGYLDDEGRMADIRKPLLVDSLAAVAGGAASTSSATTYIESASGVGCRRADRLGRGRLPARSSSRSCSSPRSSAWCRRRRRRPR